MGNCNNSTQEIQDTEFKFSSKNDYKMLYVIGRGGFGKVIINQLF